MTEQQHRGSAGARPALVIDGEATVVARHPRTRPAADRPRPASAAAETLSAEARFGRGRPQPTRQRKPPTPDLVFQTAPKQRFAVPAEQRASVLPRGVWVAGLMTLAALVPLAALSVMGSLDRSAGGTEAALMPVATPAVPSTADKPIRILYGIPKLPPTRVAFAGDSLPATLPATLGGVYPVAAGAQPAGVARLGSVRDIPNLQAARRIQLP